MSGPAATSKFESAVMEQLDAAQNLARWLMRNDHDAQDIVQESCMKALRAYDSFRGGDFRAWFLTIVRNTCHTWQRREKTAIALNEWTMDADHGVAADTRTYDPHEIAIRAADAEQVRKAIEALPPLLRETIVLREMEGLSYKEIGKIVSVPIGTVMSRLARGRAQLQALLMAADPPTRDESISEG